MKNNYIKFIKDTSEDTISTESFVNLKPKNEELSIQEYFLNLDEDQSVKFIQELFMMENKKASIDSLIVNLLENKRFLVIESLMKYFNLENKREKKIFNDIKGDLKPKEEKIKELEESQSNYFKTSMYLLLISFISVALAVSSFIFEIEEFLVLAMIGIVGSAFIMVYGAFIFGLYISLQSELDKIET